MTLSLTPLKSKVLQMEPVPFRVALVNNTEAPIAAAVSINFSSRSVKLEIMKPNGKVVVPEGLSGMNVRVFPQLFPREIAPGNRIETTQLFDTGHFQFFSKAGEYQVRASVTNSDGKEVYSEWMSLTIAEPVFLDKEAYEYLLKQMEKRPDDFVPFNKWGVEDMEEFVRQFPTTAYADYVRYVLGRNFFEKEKVKSENYFRAIDKDFVFADEIKHNLKKLEGQKKNE